jgi:hypothetical protein
VPAAASSPWLPITYRGFYDLPRAVLVEYEGETYLLDCPFDEQAAEYLDDFAVYRLPEAIADSAREPASSWIDLADAGSLLRRVPVQQVRFDKSRRHFVHSDVFAFLDE